MEQKLGHLLLATDALAASNTATETALRLARLHDAKVTIVDSVQEPSTISRWLSPNASEVFEMVVADKRARVASLVAQFAEAGIDASGDVLFGKTSEAITRAVSQLGADLVIRYMKGANSRYPGAFGNTARNLMRVCPAPILFVGDRVIDHPKVLACVNCEHDVAENQSIADAAETLATDAEHVEGIYFWDLQGKEVMRPHINEQAMQQFMEESRELHQGCYDKTIQQLQLGKLEGRMKLENGDAGVAIPEYCEREQVDVVVMCSASLNHPIQRFLGSTTEAILDQLKCALLVVKPHGFRTHVSLDDAAQKPA